MSSRAYVAHDRVVSAARMYVQMVVVGLLVAAIVYVGAMWAFVSRYYDMPIPKVRVVDGTPRLILNPKNQRLPILSLVKYFVSFNPKNYLSIRLSSNPADRPEKSELVELELRDFFRAREVPRETYRKGIFWLTRGRVDHLRWIFPTSLLFFPVFGLVYFLAFSWLNRKTEKTQFVRGADLMPFNRMSAELERAIRDEEKEILYLCRFVWDRHLCRIRSPVATSSCWEPQGQENPSA